VPIVNVDRIVYLEGGGEHIASDGFVYFKGDWENPAEGDWRIGIVTNELITQEYESGVWVTSLGNFTTINIPNYTLQPNDHFIHVIHSATAEIMIATVELIKGRKFTVKDATGDAAINNITISTQNTAKIDGLDTFVLNTNYESVTFYSDGTNWFVI
jgi:hypothetical protein